MIAKVIVWDETRIRAIDKMLKVLDDCVIFGVKTNIPFLKEILNHPEFIQGTMTTQFINQHYPNLLPPFTKTADHLKLAEVLQRKLSSRVQGLDSSSNPWSEGWRIP